MKTTMQYKDVVALWNAIFEASGKKGTKFAYAILKTKQNIRPVVDELMKLQMPPPKFVEYDDKRYAFCIEYSEKDEAGKPKTNGNNFVIEELRRAEFDEKMKAHNIEYAEAQKEFAAQVAEYNRKLNEEAEVELHTVLLSQLPSDMTSEEIEPFLPLVEEIEKESLH